MELYLQFGAGMMDHCRELLSSWGGGTVVLSPRDLKPDRISTFAAEITAISNSQVLVDPQFYLPHADHDRLCSHGFWPNDYETQLFWQGSALNELMSEVAALNSRCGSRGIILPGLLASQIDDDWIATQSAFLKGASDVMPDSDVISTIALSADATRDQGQIATLLEASEIWDPAGYYVVFEHPGDYLVDDPNWLANVLDVVAGLRLQEKEVIIGYGNHQLIAAASAKASALCSGTWMNVRSFPPDKFQKAFDDEIKKRAKWYYCPQALSEYKPPFLDIAHRQGILDSMRPSADLDGGYVDMLFSGVQPSTTDFTEQKAFRHYLHALRVQIANAAADTFDGTVELHEQLLDTAEELLDEVATAGVRGQKRDFADMIDVNRAALSLLASTRGAMLRRRWPAL